MKAASNLYSFNLTHCDFEDGSLMCGFTQNRDDTYDWQIDNTYPDHTLGSKMGEQLMNRHKKFPLWKKPFQSVCVRNSFFFYFLYFIIYYISYIFFISGHSLRNYRPGSYIMRVTSRPFNPAHAYCIRFFYKAETRQNTAGKLNVYLQVMPY